MTVYRIANNNQDIRIGDMTIEAVNGTESVPVGYVQTIDHDFPFDKEKLIENLVDLLNEAAPRHQIDSGENRVFYQRTDKGIIVNWQEGGEGISKPGMIVVVNEGSV